MLVYCMSYGNDTVEFLSHDSFLLWFLPSLDGFGPDLDEADWLRLDDEDFPETFKCEAVLLEDPYRLGYYLACFRGSKAILTS